MQYRVYNRQTLEYVDGGYVRKFNIDDDYIVNNNSTVSVVRHKDDTLKNVVVGDIITLIQDSGAYHKGVITAVDDTAYSISYKSDKELFNDNIPNPYSGAFTNDNQLKIAGKFGVGVVISLLKHYFSNADKGSLDYDELKNLPITFVADGDVLDDEGNPKMLWTWSNDSINIVDWLTELFEKYNLSLNWDIDFDISNNNLKSRNEKYIVTLSSITKSGGIVKDNVAMQTITYTVKELPDATVCRVIDSNSKELCYISSGVNLLNPATVTENEYIARSGTNWVSGKSDSEHYPNTNISGYISFDYKSKYTYSQNIGDTVTRYIIAYDKKKEKLGYFYYTATTSGGASVPFGITDFKFVVAEDDKRTDKELAAAVKYIRINYYNKATEVQLEKGDTKTAFDSFTKPAIFYLYEKDGVYSISTKNDPVLSDGRERILPVKTVIATYNESSESTDETSPENAAQDKLIPSQFNQAIDIRISADSKMFDFANAKFGDQYQIINERGSVNSVFTGRKFSNKDKWITLYFGLGRQNYTDLVQMRLRKSRYSEVYNQG